ncbi:hypothetical protein FQN57_004345 [Myotisia sp. PD_48]|nr:hypothetical protein FQN57_004345 [Myotisia sp. PD_48]
MRSLVTIGACYLDTVLTVDHYPAEDEKLRASNVSRRRGGNTVNSLEVLHQLFEYRSKSGNQEHTPQLYAIAVFPERSSPVIKEIQTSLGPNVNLQHCIYREGCSELAPSYIIRSQSTGTRTIVNYNPLAEMTVEEFKRTTDRLPDGPKWFHFEGRIPDVTLECIRYVRQLSPSHRVSVEVEKPNRPGLQELAYEADVVFYSKTWAQSKGFKSANEFLVAQASKCPKAAIGAGDTFIAGMLYKLLTEDCSSAEEKLDFANRLAGSKVVQEGFQGLGQAVVDGPTMSSPQPQNAAASNSDSSRIVVHSHLSPEYVFAFGLRRTDMHGIQSEPQESLVSPEEYGFTTTHQGICKYCQLMLHVSPDKAALHQPNLLALVASVENCKLCYFVQGSLAQGSPQVVKRYEEGDPSLCSADSTERVTISVMEGFKHTRIVPVVGQRNFDPFNHHNSVNSQNGAPMVVSTVSRLGDLKTRRIWQPREIAVQSFSPGERMRTVKTWLNECFEHEHCSRPQATNGARLPTRILDLTGSIDRPNNRSDVKLRLRETSSGEEGRYVALSYCWGTDTGSLLKTTKATINQFKIGISLHDLSWTLSDAVVSTLRLGLRYLWIDSICIIQDSPEDWRAEAANMASVYSNALLTFAATSSSGPEAGLIHNYSAPYHFPFRGETFVLNCETNRDVNLPLEPLNTRGWALQEAFLSRRIVCFGKRQMLWKCSSRYTSEDGLVDHSDLESTELNPWASVIRDGSGEDGKAYFRRWYRLIGNYSQRMLTYKKDKLVALAGMIVAVAEHTRYRHVAGLWQDDLPAGLMWQVKPGGTRDIGIIPSWSWISIDGPVLGANPQKGEEFMLEILGVEQDWEDIPLSSPLKVARLTVKGKIIKMILGKPLDYETPRYYLMASPKKAVGDVFLDDTSLVDQSARSVWCLLISARKEGKDPSDWEIPEYSVLALVPETGHSTDTYRRVGIGQIRLDDGRETFEGVQPIILALV